MYQPKVYRKDGGNTLVVANGGKILVETGGIFIGPNPSGGADYYVDGNTNNGVQDGSSWDCAFDNIAEALAASHARIASSVYRSWATRNRIFVIGDALEEDLTKLAQKTDVIGLGQCDGFFGARIKGNHVIDSTAYAGCRLFNIALHDNDASGIILTIPTQQSGIVLEDCDFLAGPSTVTGLLVTASAFFRASNCRFHGGWNSGFSTAAISIGAGTGVGTIIEDCTIGNTHATGTGILVSGTRAGVESYIRRCNIVCTAMCIDDDSDTFYIIDNRWITAGANVGTHDADINLKKAAGNIATANDHTHTVPFATVS